MKTCSPLSLDSGERNIDKLFMDKSKLAFKVQFFYTATAESAPAPSSVTVRKNCWYTAKCWLSKLHTITASFQRSSETACRALTPSGCPETKICCIQTPSWCPGTLSCCIQTPSGCQQAPNASPQTLSGCQQAPIACPQTLSGCTPTPGGFSSFKWPFARTPIKVKYLPSKNKQTEAKMSTTTKRRY